MTGKKSERDREWMCIADIKITRAYNKWEHEIKGERDKEWRVEWFQATTKSTQKSL